MSGQQTIFTTAGSSGTPESPAGSFFYTVPAGATLVNIIALGGGGGRFTGDSSSTGGSGTIVNGTFKVTPGQVLQVYVGDRGVDTDATSTSSPGGATFTGISPSIPLPINLTTGGDGGTGTSAFGASGGAWSAVQVFNGTTLTIASAGGGAGATPSGDTNNSNIGGSSAPAGPGPDSGAPGGDGDTGSTGGDGATATAFNATTALGGAGGTSPAPIDDGASGDPGQILPIGFVISTGGPGGRGTGADPNGVGGGGGGGGFASGGGGAGSNTGSAGGGGGGCAYVNTDLAIGFTVAANNTGPGIVAIVPVSALMLTKTLSTSTSGPSSSITAVSGETVGVMFSISNPNSIQISNIIISDPLPAQLMLTSSSTTSIPCGTGSTVTTTPASGTNPAMITANIAALAASSGSGSSCSFSVAAVAGAAGTGTNTASVTASTPTLPIVSSSATITVVSPAATLTKAFMPPVICFGGQSLLVFKVTNSGSSASTGISFTDQLPSNVRALMNGTQVVCGGATLTTGTSLTGSSVSLSGLSLAAGASCQFAVPVVGVVAGTQTNVAGPVSSSGIASTGPPAQASITVLPTKKQLAVMSPGFCLKHKCLRHR